MTGRFEGRNYKNYKWFIVDQKSRSSNHATTIGEPDGTIMFCREFNPKASTVRMETAAKPSLGPRLVNPNVNGLIQLDSYGDAMWLFGIKNAKVRLELFTNEQTWRKRHYLNEGAKVKVQATDGCKMGLVISTQTSKDHGKFLLVNLGKNTGIFDISQVQCCTGEEHQLRLVSASPHHERPSIFEWDSRQARLSRQGGYFIENDDSPHAQHVKVKQIPVNYKKGSIILKEHLGLVLDIIRADKLIETDFDLDITDQDSADVFLEILASLDKRKFNHLVTILKEQEQTGSYLAECIEQEVNSMRDKLEGIQTKVKDSGQRKIKDSGSALAANRPASPPWSPLKGFQPQPEIKRSGSSVMPSRIQNYDILEELGHGSFAVVYKGRCDGKLVAIKQLVAKLPTQERYHQEELDIIDLKLKHANIVTVYEYFTPTNSSVQNISIAMELCEAGDLSAYYLANNPDMATRYNFMLDMARGVCYLHINGIVHRDLKPENVLLKPLGARRVCKISDFGISKIQQRREDVFLTQIGSPAYMAPEMIDHQGYSKPVDIFALGLLFFVAFKRSILTNHLGEKALIPGYLNKQGSIIYFNSNIHKEDLNEISFIATHFIGSEAVGKLIISMIKADPQKRCEMDQVLVEITDAKVRSEMKLKVKKT